MTSSLYLGYYAMLLLFGILLSFSFADIRYEDKASRRYGLATILACAVLQGVVYLLTTEDVVWRLYPFITHLPIVLSLCFLFRKRVLTALASVTSAYLCCQPAKWFGILVQFLGGGYTEEVLTRMLVLLATGCFVLKFMAGSIAGLYSKSNRSVLLFGIVPMVYYLFDYIMNIYANLMFQDTAIAREFLPFLLCLVHLIFCQVYYQQYEQKKEMERKEELLRFTLGHQAKEVEAIRRSEQEIRMLRHDLRHLLNSVSICLEESDVDAAKALISRYTSQVDATAVKRFCTNDTLNYALIDFSARCQQRSISFQPNIQLGEKLPDMITLTSIISNALDNALNAQADLLPEQRYIQLMIKSSNSKTLVSVKNPTPYTTLFVDGMPYSPQKGSEHGYGTQSIRYLTERLGGNCQFSCENGIFTLRVIV